MHPILIYQMENGRLGCINRDRNGALNIMKVSELILRKGKRPEEYEKKNHTNLPKDLQKMYNWMSNVLEVLMI